MTQTLSSTKKLEPIADLLAVMFTAVMFAVNFKKALRKLGES